MWSWSEGEVDRTRHHIELRYGDVRAATSGPLTTVAFVGKPSNGVFPVQFAAPSGQLAEPEMVEAVRRELDFYLVEKAEPDPWAYAVYHCGTAANVYSPVHWSVFAGIVPDWNGKEMQIAQSRGGVLVATHPFDNLIRPCRINWPPAEIVQKLYKSRQERSFAGLDGMAAKMGLGFYCDLQSFHSEDAITWSVFGTLAHAPADQRELWLRDFLAVLGLDSASPAGAAIELWRRMPHPDTLTPGGPEVDFTILTENAVLLGEAKWLSGVGRGQGKERNKDQVQIRGELLAKYGGRFFPDKAAFAAVGISLLPGAFVDTTPDGVDFRAATWEQVCGIPSHPQAEEVRRYLAWKKENTRMADRSAEGAS